MARYRRDSFAPDFSKADMIGEIGGMIGGIGEDLIRAEQASQLSKANIASTAEWGAAENYFKENADKPETFVSYIRNSKSAMQKSIMAGVTNSRARPQVMADFQESHAKMLVRAEGLASIRRAENIRVDHGIAIASLEKTRSYDLGPSDAVDHIEDIHKTVEYGLAAGQYTESGAEAEKVRLTNKAVGTYITQELLKTGTPEKEALARIDSINSEAKDLFGTGENLFGPDDIDKLKKNYLAQKNFADATAKQKNDIEMEKMRGDFLVKLHEKTLTFEEISASGLPTQGDLGQQEFMKLVDQQAKDILKGDEIVSDMRIEAALEKMALDVSTGAVKLEDLSKAAAKARYTDKSIDDAGYDGIMSVANREHKTYQANALGEAISYGMRQLVSTEEAKKEMLDALIAGGGDYTEMAKKMASAGRLDEENFSQYKRAMNEWFESEKKAGRDPDDDEIYIKSRKTLVHFRGRKLDESIYGADTPEQEMKKAELSKYFRGLPGQAGKFKGKKGQSPYKEWPDAFLEDGVWKVIKDGKKYRIKD